MEAHLITFFVLLLLVASAHIRPERLLTHIESDFGATEGWLVTVNFLTLVHLHRTDHVIEGFCPGHRPCSVHVVARSCAYPLLPIPLIIVWGWEATRINMMHRYGFWVVPTSFLTCIGSQSIQGVLKFFIGALDLTTWPINTL